MEHVFSCEIEPFKQAYIERNFAPPILFRDIRELNGVAATTAYGATQPVPGDVDILIAGTSCVDCKSHRVHRTTFALAARAALTWSPSPSPRVALTYGLWLARV